MLPAPQIERSGVGTQTESSFRNDQSCQTAVLERKDFQTQATIEKESMSIQTENSGGQEFQFLASLDLERTSVAIQTIKEDITMPNIPNSVGQTQSKKRKISSTSSRFNIISSAATGTKRSDTKSNIDDAILNSEVYKIYCQNEDPKEAMKQIKKLRNCISFTEPRWSFPNETDFEIACKKALRTLLSYGTSKFETIKRFLEDGLYYAQIFQIMVPISIPEFAQFETYLYEILDNCFTRIKILLPFGFEFWYVKKFEGGVGESKWYRGVSVTVSDKHYGQHGEDLARLSIIGLRNSNINRFHYDDYLKKNLKIIPWLDFAERLLKTEKYCLFPYGVQMKQVDFDVEEVRTDNTIELIASLRLRCHNANNQLHTYKNYIGKSIRPMRSSKTRRPKNEKEEMTKEARKAALIECFKDRFGITKFSDISIDDFHRPIGK